MTISLIPSARQAKAFTLIELLVVISIIALLISILLPSLKSAREQTRSVKCLANLRSMGLGVALYLQDHNGTLPGPLHPPIFRATWLRDYSKLPWRAMNLETEVPWFLLARLAPYFNKHAGFTEYADAVATCPTAIGKNPDENFRPNVKGNPDWSRPFNYLINSWANSDPDRYFGWTNIGVTWTGWVRFHEADPKNPSYQPPKKLARIRRLSDEWMIGDAWWDFRRAMIRPGQFEDTMLGTWQLGSNNPGESANSSHNPLPRAPYHGGGRGTNLVFFDNHAETYRGIDEWAQRFPANRPAPE